MARFTTCLVAVLALVAFATNAPAQVQTGEIFGKVSDPSKAVLPGVMVTLESPVLLRPSVAITSATGAYQFPRLLVGTYRLKFELDGFSTLIREDIRVELGLNVQLNVQLGISSVAETVVVTGESPIVDTRNTGTRATFTQEQLQAIPSGRDPWVILQQTPAVSMDRENVGGTASGQQSGYVSRGSIENTNWNLDGMVITSAATGASPIYFDFDTIEEMQITTGGSDASVQTGGVGIHVVTKSGTDKFRGSARAYGLNDKLQSDNVDENLRKQGAGSGAPVQSIVEYGVEAGGPIKKGRAWFWGSYGKQDIKVGVLGFYKPGTKELATDLTAIKTYNLKGQVAPFKSNKITWYTNLNDKIRNARDASDTRPPETTYKQTAPVWTHKISDQQIFSDRFLMEYQFAYVGGTLLLDFPSADLSSVQRSLELVSPANLYGRSFGMSDSDRPQYNFDVTSNYFMPGTFGGDHSLRMGLRYRNTPTYSVSHIGGFATARFRNGVPVEADLHRDSATNYSLKTTSAYLHDTYTRGRLTMNVGVRFDRQDDRALASEVPANPILPTFLPAVTFFGADPPKVFSDFSPRFGMTFNVRGDGKTVAKLSVARYYGQVESSSIAGILNPVNAASVRFPWNDLNGDKSIQANELDTTRVLAFSGNYDPSNPSFIGTKNTVDPNIKNDAINEVVVGLDHQLMANFAIGATYIWRRYEPFTWDAYVGMTGADWVPVSYRATGCPEGCPTVTYYEPQIPVPGVRTRTNRTGYWRGYNGLEVTARKRLSNRWMMNASFAYNDPRDHYTSVLGYADPTQISFLNGAQYAPEDTSSGRAGVNNNARWLAKISGLYSLPYGINVSSVYNAHQGYPFVRTILSPSRANRAGTVLVLLDPVGSVRLDTVQLVDFKLEKVFSLPASVKLHTMFEVFNVANVNTTLIKQTQQNSTSANLVRDIVPPRIARLGIRFVW